MNYWTCLVFLLGFVGVKSCKFLENIQEQVADLELENDGFHRNYVSKVKITSMERFMDCQIAYKIVIPRGAFIDESNLNSSLINHCYREGLNFDTETPSFGRISSSQPIFLFPKIPIRKLFIFEDELQFPVDIRYHAPSDNNSKAEIKFQIPEVFISCKNNKTEILNDKRCERFLRRIPCGCGQVEAECEFLRLNVQPKFVENVKNIVKIPVGNIKQRNHIFYGTIFVVAGLVAWICKVLLETEEKKKKE